MVITFTGTDEQKKAAPSSGLSGMVTRFTRPFDLRRRDTSPGETRVSCALDST